MADVVKAIAAVSFPNRTYHGGHEVRSLLRERRSHNPGTGTAFLCCHVRAACSVWASWPGPDQCWGCLDCGTSTRHADSIVNIMLCKSVGACGPVAHKKSGEFSFLYLSILVASTFRFPGSAERIISSIACTKSNMLEFCSRPMCRTFWKLASPRHFH